MVILCHRVAIKIISLSSYECSFIIDFFSHCFLFAHPRPKIPEASLKNE